MHYKGMTMLCQAVVVCALWIFGVPIQQSVARAQTTEETPGAKIPKPKKPKNPTGNIASTETGVKTKVAAPVKNASEAEIGSAKASGQVWVNTETGVYHKSGKWFGATKQGKFMTEQDAIKAGYRAAKNEK
jgi:hypothetical protein